MKRDRRVKALLFLLFLLIVFRLFMAWDPVANFISRFVTPLGSQILSLDSREENKETVAENAQIDLLQAENQELRDELGITGTADTIGAEVIRLDMTSYRKTVWINAGSDAGLAVNDAVLHQGYLFGRVVGVNENISEVQVITDPEFSVTAQYDREHGVIKNSYGSLLFDLVPRGDIESGKIIVTDGIDGTFKPGIPVAFVAHNITQPGNVFFTYNIYLIENPNNVRFVQVMR